MGVGKCVQRRAAVIPGDEILNDLMRKNRRVTGFGDPRRKARANTKSGNPGMDFRFLFINSIVGKKLGLFSWRYDKLDMAVSWRVLTHNYA